MPEFCDDRRIGSFHHWLQVGTCSVGQTLQLITPGDQSAANCLLSRLADRDADRPAKRAGSVSVSNRCTELQHCHSRCFLFPIFLVAWTPAHQCDGIVVLHASKLAHAHLVPLCLCAHDFCPCTTIEALPRELNYSILNLLAVFEAPCFCHLFLETTKSPE